MRIIDAISMADAVKPNAFDEATKIRWLSEVEGMIQADIWLLAPEEWIEYDETTPTDTQLLVTGGHSKIYRAYLCAMIDLANGEYDHYANTSAVVNDYLQEYELWYARVYHPADTWREVWKGHYFTAYGLAVKHGYAGTEAEWLASLRGPQGEPFRYEDFTAEQLAALVGPQGPKGEKGDPGLTAVVDTSLTMEGAVADAAAVGKRILPLEAVSPRDHGEVLFDEAVAFTYDSLQFIARPASAPDLVDGETYTFMIDGLSYVSVSEGGWVNAGGYGFSKYYFIGTDDRTHHIVIAKGEIKQLDEKFVPNGIARKTDLGEEWQLLSDYTTTKEITKFSVDHDMNWQPFSCRKIAAKIVMPSAFGSVVMIWYGMEGSEPCVAMFAQNSAKVIEFSMEMVKGCYHVLSYQQRESDFVGAGLNHEQAFDMRRLDRKNYDFFGFSSGAAFPVGTRIIVWGCKA